MVLFILDGRRAAMAAPRGMQPPGAGRGMPVCWCVRRGEECGRLACPLHPFASRGWRAGASNACRCAGGAKPLEQEGREAGEEGGQSSPPNDVTT
eukprot:scaffold10145_cov116-Isochrysis_galbana.AAC.8